MNYALCPSERTKKTRTGNPLFISRRCYAVYDLRRQAPATTTTRMPDATPALPAPSGVVASARLCCLSRVPPAVCPTLLESATTAVCTSFLQSLSAYVHTPTPHFIIRFRPAPQTPDVHTSNLPHVANEIQERVLVRSGNNSCLLYTSPSPRDGLLSRMPSSA